MARHDVSTFSIRYHGPCMFKQHNWTHNSPFYRGWLKVMVPVADVMICERDQNCDKWRDIKGTPPPPPQECLFVLKRVKSTEAGDEDIPDVTALERAEYYHPPSNRKKSVVLWQFYRTDLAHSSSEMWGSFLASCGESSPRTAAEFCGRVKAWHFNHQLSYIRYSFNRNQYRVFLLTSGRKPEHLLLAWNANWANPLWLFYCHL